MSNTLQSMVNDCKKIYLCSPNLDVYGYINGIRTSSVSLSTHAKDFWELSFTVDRYIVVDGVEVTSSYYEDIRVLMYLYLEDIGYFKIQEPHVVNDGNSEWKEITAYSCDKEFEERDWIGLKVNTGDPDSLEQLATNNLNDLGFAKEFVKFYYTRNTELSFLHILLQKMNGWTIGYIDPRLCDQVVPRIDVNNANLYAILTTHVGPKLGILFVFDILHRTINAYHKDNIDFETNIFIGFRNLANEVNVEVNEDSVFTRIKVRGDGDLDFRNYNFGSDQVWDLSYFMMEPWMNSTLANKITAWQNYRDNQRSTFLSLEIEAATINDKLYQLKYRVPSDATYWKSWANMNEEGLYENLALFTAQLTALQLSVDTRSDSAKYTNYTDIQNRVYKPYTTAGGAVDHQKYLNLLYNSDNNGYGGYYTYQEIITYIIPYIQTAITNRNLPWEEKISYGLDSKTNWDLYGTVELEAMKTSYEDDQLPALNKYSKDWDELTEEEQLQYVNEENYNTMGRNTYVQIKEWLGDTETPGTIYYRLKQLYDELDALNARLDVVNNQMNSIKANVDMEATGKSWSFTPKELRTINGLFVDTDYTNTNILSTSVDTTVSKLDKEQELYEDATDMISELAQPQYTFQVELDNLLRIPEFQPWVDDLQLLRYVRLGIRDDYSVKLRIVGIQYNPCEVDENLVLTFSSMITSKSGRNDFTELINDENQRAAKNGISIGTGNSETELEYLTSLLQMLSRSGGFNSLVRDIAGVSNTTTLNDFIDGTYKDYLDMVIEQADAKAETWYQDTDPSLAWTTEELQSLHAGDIWYNTSTTNEQYLADGSNRCYLWSGTDWDLMDINPPSDVFDTIDGKASVYISQPTPPYREKDLWVNATFTDGQVSYSDEIMKCIRTRETGNFNASDWTLASKYTDDTLAQSVKDQLTNFLSGDFVTWTQEIQRQDDEKGELFYQSADPSTDWTNSTLRNKHIGDIWCNTATGIFNIWTGTEWSEMKTNPPASLVDTINGKANIFTGLTTPSDPKTGDLWFKGANYPIYTYTGSDWEVFNKYTDDTAFNNFISNEYADLQTVVDSKAQTWYQSTDPSGSWDDLIEHTGDIWYNTSSNVQKTYRWTGAAWQELTATPPNAVFDRIDGKATVWLGNTTPASPHSGDLWMKSANDDILTYVNNQWVKYNKYTDDSALTTFINGAYKDTIDDIKEQTDGKSETWYQSTNPANNWSTTEEKASHKGDIWYNTSSTSQKYYIYSGTAWLEMKTEPPSAIMDVIDGKAQIFATQPTPPYYQNDVWFNGEVIKVCVTSRASGSFVASDWAKKDTYTDDSALTTFLSGQYSTDLATINGLIDEKIQTWHQATDPQTTESWTAAQKEKHVGDIWYDTTNDIFKQYTSSYTWDAMVANPPDAIMDTIDGKGTIYTSATQPTTGMTEGDLWFPGPSSGIYTYHNNSWQEYNKYTSDAKFTQHFDESNGLIIYENTSTTNAFNVQITASSVNIRKNTTTYASYGASTIFYIPGTSYKALEISSSGLSLYKENSSTAAATLDSDGLNIAYGSINIGSKFVVDSTGELTLRSATSGNRHTLTMTSSGLSITYGSASTNTQSVSIGTSGVVVTNSSTAYVTCKYGSTNNYTGSVFADSGGFGLWSGTYSRPLIYNNWSGNIYIGYQNGSTTHFPVYIYELHVTDFTLTDVSCTNLSASSAIKSTNTAGTIYSQMSNSSVKVYSSTTTAPNVTIQSTSTSVDPYIYITNGTYHGQLIVDGSDFGLYTSRYAKYLICMDETSGYVYVGSNKTGTTSKVYVRNTLDVTGDITFTSYSYSLKATISSTTTRTLIKANSSGNMFVGAPSKSDAQDGDRPGSMYLCADTIYHQAAGSSIDISDRKFKKDIEDIEDEKAFIMALRPRWFKFKKGTSNRYHAGFIAQEVSEAMSNNIRDFGVYCEDYLNDDSADTDEENIISMLRYEELIAPHIALTQEHERRISELEEEIKLLKEQISLLLGGKGI